MKSTISKSYSFDAAHQLWRPEWSDPKNYAVFGKCANIHGHTYTLDVTVEGEVDPDTGMVINYFELDAVVKPYVYSFDKMGVAHGLDHNFLNIFFGRMLTTSENMVAKIGQDLVALWDQAFSIAIDASIVLVSLAETPKTAAVWEA
jgi:6-pyruvoyltetrahydropterin/6-carboxytetrahydropterin synthase